VHRRRTRVPDHAKLVRKFVTYLADTEGFVHHTARRYQYHVERWLIWLGKTHRRNVTQATKDDASEWFGTIRAAGYATSTVAQVLSSVRKFHEWLIDEGWMEHNPFARIRRPKVYYKLRPWLSEEQMTAILAHPVDNTFRDLRDRTALLLLYSTGARNSEVRMIDISDLQLDMGRVMLQKTKNGEPAWAWLSPTTVRAINTYLEHARPLRANYKSGDALIIGERGARIDKMALRDAIRRVAVNTGIPLADHVTPHTLRKTAATHLRQEGADLVTVQHFLRHKRLETTRIYIGAEMLKELDEVDRHHPLERLLHHDPVQ